MATATAVLSCLLGVRQGDQWSLKRQRRLTLVRTRCHSVGAHQMSKGVHLSLWRRLRPEDPVARVRRQRKVVENSTEMQWLNPEVRMGPEEPRVGPWLARIAHVMGL